MKEIINIILTIIFIFIFSCAKNDFSIEKKDGFTIVYNYKENFNKSEKIFKIEFEKKIGELDSKDDNYLLYTPWDIAEDSHENVFILELGNNRIQKYRKDGIYISTIGGPGQGPGEFGEPNSIDIINDTIYVTDIGNSRISLFSLDGVILNTIKFNETVFQNRYMGNGQFIATTYFGLQSLKLEGISDVNSLLSKYNSNGVLEKRFGAFEPHQDKNMEFYLNETYLDIDLFDNVFITFKHYNKIAKYNSEGNLLLSISRKLDYELKHINQVKVTNLTYVSSGIGIDSNGRIWCAIYKPSPFNTDYNNFLYKERNNHLLEVYSKEGILLKKFPVEENFRFMRLIGDKIYLLDPWNTMAVYEYKIVDL